LLAKAADTSKRVLGESHPCTIKRAEILDEIRAALSQPPASNRKPAPSYTLLAFLFFSVIFFIVRWLTVQAKHWW
jgi:hypothetical protein